MFGGDPFGNIFGGMHSQMHRQMRDMDRMMNSMMDPFGMLNRHSMFAGMPGMMGGMPMGMIEDGGHQQRHPQMRDDMALMDPFNMAGGGLFGGIMRQMEDLQSHAMSDPNSHVYSSSTMITFEGGRNGGQPRVIQNSVRKAGDVRETRHSVRNGDGGLGDRMSIEHTIGDRTHVIEKKRDRDGRIREQQRFVNLDQERAEDFDREFATRARTNLGGGTAPLRQAIEGGARRTTSNGNRSGRASRGHRSTNTEQASAPIVTLVDDDEEEYQQSVKSRNNSSAQRAGSSRQHATGPVIREMTDEEDEETGSAGNNAKRRKGGVLGRMFKANDD